MGGFFSWKEDALFFILLVCFLFPPVKLGQRLSVNVGVESSGGTVEGVHIEGDGRVPVCAGKLLCNGGRGKEGRYGGGKGAPYGKNEDKYQKGLGHHEGAETALFEAQGGQNGGKDHEENDEPPDEGASVGIDGRQGNGPCCE